MEANGLDCTFTRCRYDEDYELYWSDYQSYMDTHDNMLQRFVYALNLSYNRYLDVAKSSDIRDIDIDIVISVSATAAEYRTWSGIDNTLLQNAKLNWIKLVREYSLIYGDTAIPADVLYNAGKELCRSVYYSSEDTSDILARMTHIYDMYCKFVNMAYRCAPRVVLHKNMVYEYFQDCGDLGYFEVDAFVAELNDAMGENCGGSLQGALRLCEQVFVRCVGAANIGHRKYLLNGQNLTQSDAANACITEAANKVRIAKEKSVEYIEDISAAMNAMKMLIDRVHSWTDWSNAPWLEYKCGGYCEAVNVDYDCCYHYACNALTGWNIFAEYVYGMNTAVHAYLTRHMRGSVWQDAIDACDKLYAEAMDVGNRLLASAKHRETGGVSALLSMAAGTTAR